VWSPFAKAKGKKDRVVPIGARAHRKIPLVPLYKTVYNGK